MRRRREGAYESILLDGSSESRMSWWHMRLFRTTSTVYLFLRGEIATTTVDRKSRKACSVEIFVYWLRKCELLSQYAAAGWRNDEAKFKKYFYVTRYTDRERERERKLLQRRKHFNINEIYFNILFTIFRFFFFFIWYFLRKLSIM